MQKIFVKSSYFRFSKEGGIAEENFPTLMGKIVLWSQYTRSSIPRIDWRKRDDITRCYHNFFQRAARVQGIPFKDVQQKIN